MASQKREALYLAKSRAKMNKKLEMLRSRGLTEFEDNYEVRRGSGMSSDEDSLRSRDLHDFKSKKKNDQEDRLAEAYIGVGTVFWGKKSETFDWKTIDLLEEKGVTKLFLSELDADKIPRFKAPELTRELYFDGLVSQENFYRILNPLFNLKTLGIHLSTLEFLSIRPTGKSNIYLPNLETLIISANNFSQKYGDDADMPQIVSNAIALLKMQYPVINYFSLSMPLYRPKETELNGAIVSFLSTHQATIRSLKIECDYEVDDIAQSKSICGSSKGGKNSKDNNEADDESAILDLSPLKKVALETIHLLFSTPRPCGSSNMWRKFLTTQKNLKYCLFLKEGRYWQFPLKLIQQNSQTLTTIGLNVNDEKIDLSVFDECTSLKKIALKGKPKPKDKKGNKVPPEHNLINVHLAPKWLKEIQILNLCVKTDDVEILALENPLSKLMLNNIGEEGDLGMSFVTLVRLLDNKMLRHLDIVRALNRQSLRQPLNPGGSSFAPLTIALCLFRRKRSPSFRVVLKSNGEYEPLSESDSDDDDELDEEENEDEDGAYSTTKVQKADFNNNFDPPPKRAQQLNSINNNAGNIGSNRSNISSPTGSGRQFSAPLKEIPEIPEEIPDIQG